MVMPQSLRALGRQLVVARVAPRQRKVSKFMISHRRSHSHRQPTLVSLDAWAIVTRRGWLVRQVHAALVREGITHG
jgi:hypothetical protein